MPAGDIDYAKLRVLIIEDEHFTRQMIKRLLIQTGVRTIIEAADGRAGLEHVTSARPDLVFCDVHMGEFGGMAFLDGLRKMTTHGLDRTPVVMLTADANANTVMFAKERQVAGYLVKPVAQAHLKKRIDAVVAADPHLAQRLAPGTK
ncbi:MAG: response regulator [Alphaproteobacteria bacterium]|nr:response regulator [Alphaproteobacteria bacterium]